MQIHIDYCPREDCIQMKKDFFYGMCRKCNECGRFDTEVEVEMKNKKPIIINIAGKARHGKDTLAKYLMDYLYEKHNRKVQIISFGEGVKVKAKEVGWDGKKDQNGRALLQFIGTEWGRECISKEIWIKIAEQKINKQTDIIIFPDTRFKNEISYFKKYNCHFVTVRVERTDDNGMADNLKQHKSEMSLDNYDFDWHVCVKNQVEIKKSAEHIAEEVIRNV